MRTMIAMSGGVDSSVAALLAKDFSDECIGCTMKLFENDTAGLEPEDGCCGLDKTEDARSVAYRLGMHFYAMSFTEAFRKDVLEPFAAEYRRGRTPNPCIDCNRCLKFGALYTRAMELGCGCLVTGHYARVVEQDGEYLLKKALDESKDQSYVLYMLTQEQLAHIRFPLGELTKTRVREIAAEHGFVSADTPDSQDLCFVPDGDYAAAAERISGEAAVPGPFMDLDGNVIGEHRGIIHYTIGQRRGLGQSFGDRVYVVRIDPASNAVVLGPNAALFTRQAAADSFRWISGKLPEEPVRCRVKTRYRQKEQPAVVTPTGPDTAEIRFDEPQRAVTPGQAAVLYDGDTVLGGGVLI